MRTLDIQEVEMVSGGVNFESLFGNLGLGVGVITSGLLEAFNLPTLNLTNTLTNVGITLGQGLNLGINGTLAKP
ncbi:hypothetical protein HB976_11785 [Yersinia mollaretii]|uniref:Bacteriocin n=1 Tax=Yersinia mollaretii TaxID=33060 RepID=A0AA36LPI3_YERMO|nr:hypothetical protein [Yersinia mollaretii]MDA5527581.1 hypothetical protein [Yersinia mollaretii]MDA5535487.1 hypothetical protein [Yersinia mollaretii]MDR7875118.1 hypothetical protein [Yersinia mollaretii]NIL03633.1 hypothetical protein [Yersinia mollaretii]PHZ32559.1 hypothetical protein CS537_06045 [Yersinia mollaretii]